MSPVRSIVSPRPVRRRAFLQRRALLSAAALAVAGLAAAGCGRPEANYSSLRLATVGGRVTLDGQPLEGAVVCFYKEGKRTRYSYGETDADGNDTLQLNSRQPGVEYVTKGVVVFTALTGPEVSNAGGPERVPVRYNRDTEFTAEVEMDGDHTFNFDLASDGEIVEPDPDMLGEGDGEGD